MDALRYRLGRHIRALARWVEPPVDIDWDREARLANELVMTSITSNWPAWTTTTTQSNA